jgi:hypothetical protein
MVVDGDWQRKPSHVFMSDAPFRNTLKALIKRSPLSKRSRNGMHDRRGVLAEKEALTPWNHCHNNSPCLCFAGEELRAGQIVTNALGPPMPRSGNPGHGPALGG